MIGQDHGLVLPERIGDAATLFGIEHDTGIALELADLLIERAGILGERLDGLVEGRQRLAVDPVRVSRAAVGDSAAINRGPSP